MGVGVALSLATIAHGLWVSGIHLRLARPGLFGVLVVMSVPATTWLCRHPIKLAGFAGAVQVAVDTGVLVMLALVGTPALALATWLAGVVGAEVLERQRLPLVRAFNAGLAGTAGSALVACVAWFAPAGGLGPQDLLAVVAGTVAYSVIDLGATAVSVAWGERTSALRALLDPALPTALASVMAVNGLGLLTVLLCRQSAWALPLLIAPVAAMMHAAHAGARAHRARDRSTALFNAAAACHDAQDPDAISDGIVAAAQDAVAARVALRGQGPKPGELGVQVPGAADWLIAAPRAAGTRFKHSDRQALTLLVALAAQARARVAAERALRHAAAIDAVTGLINRATWDERFEAAVAEGPAARPSVIYIDLDGFKAINDRHGHAAGDDVLRIVAQRLGAAVRRSDTVARLGGDEFGVLLVGAEVAELAEIHVRLQDALTEPLSLPQGVLVPHGSTGVASWRAGDTAGALLRRADHAMYDAKRARLTRAGDAR